jgi:predicted metal-dependent phosphoesterase TrpH
MKKPSSNQQIEKMTPEEIAQIETVGAVLHPEGKPPAGMMKVDLHCHSEASHDCTTPLTFFPECCRRQGVRVQAITDHNQIWGAQKLQEWVAERAQKEKINLTIIVGEEISTREGEIIGLFLQEKIEPNLSPEETVAQIKAQGGLVLLPHGFDPLKRYRLKPDARQRVAKQIDIVETFNARISRPRWNQAAVLWCEERGVLMSGGSDAHTPADIGSAWVELPRRPIAGPADLLNALAGGVPAGKWTHPVLAYMYKMWDRARRRFRTPRPVAP